MMIGINYKIGHVQIDMLTNDLPRVKQFILSKNKQYYTYNTIFIGSAIVSMTNGKNNLLSFT